VEATILLCDAAEAINGKLYVLGGGWSVTGPTPAPSALAIKIDVPWTDANRRFPVAVELLTADGDAVTVPDPLGNPQPITAAFELEVGRPPGVPHGTPLDATVAFTIPPLPLTPGQRFAWHLTIDGESKPHWQVGFSTRASGPP
jgi:hypothetical protein